MARPTEVCAAAAKGLVAAFVALGLVSCTCSDAPKADGLREYRACAAMDAPKGASWTAGGHGWKIDGRTLVHGGQPNLSFAVIRGAAPLDRPLNRSALQNTPLVVVLGNLGDTEEAAKAELARLATVPSTFVFVAGGRDEAPLWDSLFANPPGKGADHPATFVDARPLREIRIGETSLALLSGAPRGRYARNEESCGYGEDDLDALVSDLAKAPPGGRWLLSWAAPAGKGAGLGGMEGGDPALAKVLGPAGISRVLYAWPGGLRDPTIFRLGPSGAPEPAGPGPEAPNPN